LPAPCTLRKREKLMLHIFWLNNGVTRNSKINLQPTVDAT
jgi:hypothetical protein